MTFVTHGVSLLSLQCNPFIMLQTPRFRVSMRKPHHSRLQGLPLACGSLICLTAVEAPTAGRGSRQRTCEERKGTCKGGVNSPAIFSFLTVSLSARKICLNWGESIVHPADALWARRDSVLAAGPLSSLANPQTSPGPRRILSRV